MLTTASIRSLPQRRHACRGFTLIELLLVIIVGAVMIGAAVPAINSFGRGGGVQAGARMVTSQLHLARQYAITQRKRVAIVFDSDNARFRACIVDTKDPNNNKWVPNSKWEHLPTGAVFDPAYLPSNIITPVGNLPALIFRPTGALYITKPQTIRVSEGFIEAGTATPRLGTKNIFDLEINPYTGKVNFKE